MDSNTDVGITPENCARLVDILDMDDPEQREGYEFTEACTRVYLLSNIPERKNFAIRRLKEFYNPHAEIFTLEKESIVWAYLSLEPQRKGFFLVNKYRRRLPELEPVPKEWETKLW